MSSDKNNQDSKNNQVAVVPDYSQMIKNQTNGAIVESFLGFLFREDVKFGPNKFFIMFRNIICIVIIKSFLEESKSYLDKFKFANLNIFQYQYQKIRNSEVVYDILMVGGKWTYDKNIISTNTLRPFLEQKQIYLDKPGTYYYIYSSFLIKVIVDSNKISFRFPNIVSVIDYINQTVINAHIETLFAGKTTMFKVNSISGILSLKSVNLAYAIPTENYRKLEESISNNYIMDKALQFSHVPVCINFDGEPGTGKTSFGSYIAPTGIIDRIIIFNLVPAAEMNFTDSITAISRLITTQASKDRKIDDPETILIIFDEIDKWLESHIEYTINKLREEARGKKQSSGGTENKKAVIENYKKLTPKEEDDKRLIIRTKFLDDLYKLVDGHMLPETIKFLLIFNTNHFDGLFDGVGVRYVALKDRFQRYTFKKMNKIDLINYLRCIGNKLKDHCDNILATDQKKFALKPSIKLLCDYSDDIFDQIPNHIQITYRTAQKVLRRNSSNIKKTVMALCDETDEEIYPKESTITIIESQKKKPKKEEKDTDSESEEEPISSEEPNIAD